VLHLDVDVIGDFPATNYSGNGGLGLEDVREALLVFAQQKHLAAIEVTAYNPAKDADGSGAKLIIDLLAEVLSARLETLNAAATAAAPAAAGDAAKTPEPSPAQSKAAAAGGAEKEPPPVVSGEAWSSDMLEESAAGAETADSEPSHHEPPPDSNESEGSPS